MPAIPKVNIDFQPGGVAEVKNAVKNIQDVLDKLAKSSVAVNDRAAKLRVAAEQKVASETERIAAETDKKTDAHFNYRLGVRQRHFLQEQRAEERATEHGERYRQSMRQRYMLQEQRRTEQLDRYRERVRLNTAAREQRVREQEDRKSERKSDQLERYRLGVQLKTAANAQRERDREDAKAKRKAEQNEKYLQGIRQRHFQEQQRKEEHESERLERYKVSVRLKSLKAAEKEYAKIQAAERANAVQSSERMSMFGRAAKNGTGRALGAAGRIAGLAAAVGGGFTIADALRGGIDLEANAGQIVRSASVKGDVTGAKIVSEAKAAAMATGGQTADIVGGLDNMVRLTGDLPQALSMLQDLAKISAATGASMEDMGKTAGEVFNQVGNKADTLKVLLSLAGQGQAGAIDIRDIGEYGARITSSAAFFGGAKTDNIERMGALSQIAKKLGGASSPRVAMEAASSLVDDILSKEADINSDGIVEKGKNKGKKRPGVKTRDANGKLRAPEEIFADMLEESGGDLGTFTGIFGESSGKVAHGFAIAYKGYDAQNGQHLTGRDALTAMMNDMRNSRMTEQDVEAGVTSKLAENQAKLNIATERFHAALNDKLLPMLPGLIDSFTRAIPAISEFVGVIAENPLKSLGAALVASVVKDLAAAGIGMAVKAALLAQIEERVATSVAAKLAEAGVGGTAAKVGAGATLGTGLAPAALGASIVASGIVDYQQKKSAYAGLGNVGSATDKIASAIGDVRSGKISIDEAAKVLGTGQSLETSAKRDLITTAAANSGMGFGLGGTGINTVKAAEVDKFSESLKALQSAIDEAAKNIEQTSPEGERVSMADPNHPARGPTP